MNITIFRFWRGWGRSSRSVTECKSIQHLQKVSPKSIQHIQKVSILKQINSADSANKSANEAENKASEFNFVTRPNQSRLTNAILKQVLNRPGLTKDKRPKPVIKSKTPQLTDFIGRKINKKAKNTIKKNLWQQSNKKIWSDAILNVYYY